MKVFLRISSVLGIIAALVGGYFLFMEETTIGLILTLGGLTSRHSPKIFSI